MFIKDFSIKMDEKLVFIKRSPELSVGLGLFGSGSGRVRAGFGPGSGQVRVGFRLGF